MKVEKIYPSLLVADLAAAERWYTDLLGRGPDHRPMPTLLHWELFGEAGLIADLAAERRRLESAGIVLGEYIAGDYSTLAQVRDPDGNLVTLATSPSRAFPSA